MLKYVYGYPIDGDMLLADASSNWRWQKIIGLVPIIALPIAMLYQLIFAENSLVFNPPYLPLILQAIFVLGTSLVVAYVSARGYLKSGSLNLVFLTSALLVNGLTTTISVIPLGLPSNTIVTMANLGIFTSSILQLIGAITTLFPQFSTEAANRKAIIITALTGSFLLIGLAIALAFSGLLPVFLGPTGPTPIRLAILWTTIALLFGSSLLFTFRYLKTKSNILYWYSLALALFTLAILASVFTVALGDIMNWVSRLAIYLSGIYFLLALLSPEPSKAESAVSQRWAETFGANRVQSAALFDKALNGFAYAKILTDGLGKPVDWIYLDVNAAFEKISGAKQENIIGKRVTSVFPKESTDPTNWVGKFGAVALTGKPISVEAFSQSFGKWIQVSAYSPKKGYFVSVFEDVTERKKAEEALRESEERLRFHAENTPLAVVEWDSKFVVTRWAGDAEKMFGWTASETIGKPIMDLHMIYEPDIPIVEKTMSKLTSGQIRVVSSNRNVTKDGRVIYCTWYNSVLLDAEGKMISVFSFVEDDTAKVKVEKELEENNKNLEKLVEERTMQLKDSERLAAIGATAGMVGHDIRNPLQAIVSDLFIARQETADMPDTEAKKSMIETLDEIEANIFYINKIVGDLQDYARPLNPQAHENDIESVIKHAIANSHIPKKIKIDYEIAPEAHKIIADIDFLKRIVSNLTLNAVQAMPNGGKLTIRVSIDKETGDTILTVKDTGVGIPDSIKEKLFTPMFTTKSKGQGFGLAVVKRMTEGLDGTISFESEVNKGTTFTVRLPTRPKK